MRLMITFLIIFSSCDMNKSDKNLIQDKIEIEAIKEILTTQQNYWNNGDIDGFMLGYWNSKDLVFTSLKHEPTYGWQATLERYKISYPTKSKMGNLKFQILNTKLTTLKTATLKGKWELIRKEDNPKGMFWLELEKFNTKWLITKDSTLSFE